MHYDYHLTLNPTTDNYTHLTLPFSRYQLLTLNVAKKDLNQYPLINGIDFLNNYCLPPYHQTVSNAS